MKIKVKISLIAFALAIAFTTAQAQRGHDGKFDPEKRAEHKTAMLTEKLGLTEKQVAQVKEINLSFGEKMKTQKEEPNKENRKALREEHEAAIANILTAEQKEKYETLKAERMDKKGKHGKGHHGNIEDRKAMHEEMQSYRKENIHPVMLAQRAKLDDKISDTDQKTIVELQDKMKNARKEGRAGQEGKAKDDKMGDHNGKGFRHGHFGMHAIMQDEATRQQVEKLVETYSADIDGLFAEIAPQTAQWETDKKALYDKYRKGDMERKNKGDKEGKEPNEDKAAKRDFHKKVHFLLMPKEAELGNNNAPQERKINVFPNPAGTTQNIEFEVLTAGNVKVDIIDQQGNKVKSVFDGKLPAGMNKLEINTGDLTGKMYYYRITDAKGTTSKSFFIK